MWSLPGVGRCVVIGRAQWQGDTKDLLKGKGHGFEANPSGPHHGCLVPPAPGPVQHPCLLWKLHPSLHQPAHQTQATGQLALGLDMRGPCVFRGSFAMKCLMGAGYTCQCWGFCHPREPVVARAAPLPIPFSTDGLGECPSA